MKIVFFGTPDYVLPIVEMLHKTYNDAREKQFLAVVTQEPKESGRDKKISRSAVDNWAYKHKIDVIFDLDEVPEADLGIVAAYGRIIPQYVIDRFAKGLLNIHPSLLPKFRGASPIQAAIASGEKTTGVSIIKMDNLMDHGPLVSSFKQDILPTDTNESLRDSLFERCAQFLIDLIPHYLSGKIKLKEQDHDSATFTKLITKQNGFIPSEFIAAALEGKTLTKDFEISFIKNCTLSEFNAQTFYNLYRALYPWSGVWTIIKLGSEEKRLKILEAHIENDTLVMDEVQLEGKNAVTWEQFKMGYPTVFSG